MREPTSRVLSICKVRNSPREKPHCSLFREALYDAHRSPMANSRMAEHPSAPQNKKTPSANFTLPAAGVFLFTTVILGLPVNSISLSERPLIATAEIISQKYCPGDADLFRVDLDLQIKYENRTNKVLILDKQFGKFADEQIIAKSKESLALKDYESYPIFDQFVHEEDPKDFKPSVDLMRSNFILLPPGQILKIDTIVEAFVWYESKLLGKGAINYGDHVLQMGFTSWSYKAKASQFAEPWSKFGQLVTDIIYTEPIAFQIPKNPKIERTCN